MQVLVRGLTWPIISLVAIGATHLVADLVRPQLATLITAPTVMPIYLAAGAWAGYGVVRAGGGFLLGLAAGAILGVLPFALQVVGFGFILGRDPDAVLTAAIFGLAGVFWGSSLGSGAAAARGSAVAASAGRSG
jgi:hypothetical protein